MKTFLVLLSAVGTWLSLVCESMAFLAWDPTGIFVYGVSTILFAAALKAALWWADRG